jgi:hypothetical protein
LTCDFLLLHEVVVIDGLLKRIRPDGDLRWIYFRVVVSSTLTMSIGRNLGYSSSTSNLSFLVEIWPLWLCFLSLKLNQSLIFALFLSLPTFEIGNTPSPSEAKILLLAASRIVKSYRNILENVLTYDLSLILNNSFDQ